jgi:hypothetical protein
LYDEHGIDPEYDSQDAYGVPDSHFGDGRYPPDWPARREAVWERQRYQCGRCGVYKGDVSASEVHHVVHLSDGGSNGLENLVGLCGNCHALMHPSNDRLRGNPWEADLFPSERADDRVAVVREPRDDDALALDVERLAGLSSPADNAESVTSAAVPTSAAVARRAGSELPAVLRENGFVPRSAPYHRIRVRPRPDEIPAVLTADKTEVTARGDGAATELDRDGDGGATAYHSADTETAEVTVDDPTGATRTERVATDHADGSRLRVEVPVSAPAFSTGTAPAYAVGALRYFGWTPLKLGIVPAVVVAVARPSLVAAGSLVGIIAVALFAGLLLRLPRMYRDATADPTGRVVDERAE